jgi:Flp pilus assembly pilin Flp
MLDFRKPRLLLKPELDLRNCVSAMNFLKLFRPAKRLVGSENGATTVEYAIMLVVLIATMLSAIQVLGPSLNSVFNETADAVSIDEG